MTLVKLVLSWPYRFWNWGDNDIDSLEIVHWGPLHDPKNENYDMRFQGQLIWFRITIKFRVVCDISTMIRHFEINSNKYFWNGLLYCRAVHKIMELGTNRWSMIFSEVRYFYSCRWKIWCHQRSLVSQISFILIRKCGDPYHFPAWKWIPLGTTMKYFDDKSLKLFPIPNMSDISSGLKSNWPSSSYQPVLID